MLTADLVFIRHTETIANVQDIRQGHMDFPLTASGIEMAVHLGRALRYMKWDLIYSSDLTRATEVSHHIMLCFIVPIHNFIICYI
jgi:probable phosphoglycerate mutase